MRHVSRPSGLRRVPGGRRRTAVATRRFVDTIPIQFSSEQRKDLLREAGAAESLALSSKYEQAISSVVKGYTKFFHALEPGAHAVSFSATFIKAYMTHWVSVGNTARSIAGNLTKLRRAARRMRQPFPAIGTDEWSSIKDLERALLKIDPTLPKRATVFHLRWIVAVLERLGIRTVNDFSIKPLRDVQLAARLLLCHAAMMRGCEHRDGMAMSDIVASCVQQGYGRVLVHIAPKRQSKRAAARLQLKKLKLRPARTATLAVWPSIKSAGAALLIYLQRLTSVAPNSAILFPLIDAHGTVHTGLCLSDKQFIKLVVEAATAAGMSKHDAARVTSHSLRAGGATDYAVANMSKDFIRVQGGWTTDCFMIYVRPQTFHSQATAVQVMKSFTLLDAHNRR